MPLSEEKKPKKQHNIIMENREKLTFSGVIDVDSFDENSVVVFTELGELSIKGEGLHVDNLDTSTGELIISGTVNGRVYSDTRQKSGSWLGRVFR